jgi:hypothetical protein
MTIRSNEPDPDAMIAGLHKIRQDLLAEHGDNLAAYVAAAQTRQNESGRPIVTRPQRSPTAEKFGTTVPGDRA